MTESIGRTKLKAAQLEAAIMERLGDNPDCPGIIQVYVKATGLEPPERQGNGCHECRSERDA